MFLSLPEHLVGFSKCDKINSQKLFILPVSNPLLLALKNDII